MIRGQGKCVKCGVTTYNSKSGLCRRHWEERSWSKDKENAIIYPNGKTDGEIIDTSKIR